MYTQCPHCNTLFRVHAKQLRVAHGRVRCSRCKGAFHALEHLGKAPVVHAAPGTPETDPPPKPDAVRRSRRPAKKTNEDLPFEVPDNLPDIAAAPGDDLGLPIETQPPAPRRLAWNLGAVALTGLLILQVAWINRETLAGYPQGRYLLEKFCGLAQCSVPTRVAPDRIRILSRDVGVRPEKRNAHQVRLIIANDAPFPQPYPLLRMEFFTGDAKLIARRSFTPREYLPAYAQSDALMAPGQTAQLQLDLADPGRPVSGYRFAFTAP